MSRNVLIKRIKIKEKKKKKEGITGFTFHSYSDMEKLKHPFLGLPNLP